MHVRVRIELKVRIEFKATIVLMPLNHSFHAAVLGERVHFHSLWPNTGACMCYTAAGTIGASGRNLTGTFPSHDQFPDFVMEVSRDSTIEATYQQICRSSYAVTYGTFLGVHANNRFAKEL